MSVQPITVSAADVAHIVLAAHEAGTLVAQANLGGSYYEKVDGKVYRCAIGQCFTEDEANYLQRGSGDYLFAGGLIEQGLIVTKDRAAIVKIQDLHDAWAARSSSRRLGSTDAEKAFVDYCRELVGQ